MTNNYTDNEMSKISRAEYKRGRVDREKEILKIIGFCKICGGSHGEWIRKEELKAKIQEMQNER